MKDFWRLSKLSGAPEAMGGLGKEPMQVPWSVGWNQGILERQLVQNPDSETLGEA